MDKKKIGAIALLCVVVALVLGIAFSKDWNVAVKNENPISSDKVEENEDNKLEDVVDLPQEDDEKLEVKDDNEDENSISFDELVNGDKKEDTKKEESKKDNNKKEESKKDNKKEDTKKDEPVKKDDTTSDSNGSGSSNDNTGSEGSNNDDDSNNGDTSSDSSLDVIEDDPETGYGPLL